MDPTIRNGNPKHFVFDPIYDQLQRVMDLRNQQHGLVSSNLANANTPNYKAKEVEFDQTLRDVMERDSGLIPMARTSQSHIGGRRGAATEAEIIEHEAEPWSPDGNSVVPEEESAKLMENSLMYKTLSRLIRKKFDGLQTAISEGR